MTRDFCAGQFNFNALLTWHYELKPGPTKHNNNNNDLQRQHKPRPATRHFREEYCQVTRKLEHYELQPRPATRKPKYYVNIRANSRTSPISPALLGQTRILAGRSTEKTEKYARRNLAWGSCCADLTAADTREEGIPQAKKKQQKR